jgi:hypothetical protein
MSTWMIFLMPPLPLAGEGWGEGSESATAKTSVLQDGAESRRIQWRGKELKLGGREMRAAQSIWSTSP